MNGNPNDDTARAVTATITDPETLRGDVPFHEETERVDRERFETVAELDDMAPVGVVNEDGDVLVMRVTETCDWKVPTSTVTPGESYAAAAQEWVETKTGIDLVFDGIVGVWRYEVRLESAERVAERNFVVFRASPEADGAVEIPTDAVSEADRPADVGWFESLPAGGSEVPGTEDFFE